MKLGKNLSVKEMKKIVHQIIEEEEKEWGVKLNIFPFTIIEYYTNDIFKEKLKLTNSIHYIKAPFINSGINDGKGNAIIFLNSYKSYKKIEKRLFHLLLTCYHEYRHSIQEEFEYYNYDGALDELECFLRYMIAGDYSNYYNTYSTEIGAHLYAARKAKSYMIKNYPELYEKHKKEIDDYEEKHIFYYMTYDASDLIDRVIQGLNNYNNNKDNKITFEEIPYVLEIFLNYNLKFRTIKEIKKNADNNFLDKKILYAFLSSNSFLENIDLEKLDNEELQLLNEALEYTCTLYSNQYRYIEKNKKDTIEYLKSKKSIVRKISKIEEILDRKLESFFGSTRSEKKRQEHIRNVETYLNETEKMIGNRKL